VIIILLEEQNNQNMWYRTDTHCCSEDLWN